MTVAAWMPGAVHKPISYRGAAGRFRSTPLGWILHVVVGNGSPYNGFEHAQPGDRKFSNFWVAKSGLIEQYAESYCISWAQEAGNPQYVSVETEGFPNEPLTDAQIASLARIHVFLEAPNAIASRPGQKGIGTHYMGGAAWGGHTCPDPSPGVGPRSHQRGAILAAAKSPTPAPTEDDVPTTFNFNYDANQALVEGTTKVLEVSSGGTSILAGADAAGTPMAKIVDGDVLVYWSSLPKDAFVLYKPFLVSPPLKAGEQWVITGGSGGFGTYNGVGGWTYHRIPVTMNIPAGQRLRLEATLYETPTAVVAQIHGFLNTWKA